MNLPGKPEQPVLAIRTKRFLFLLISSLALVAFDGRFLPAQEGDQSQIERYSEQAEQAMAAKDWEQAAKALEQLARLAPNVAEVQANLGLSYYSLNKTAEAARAFGRALKLNPKMPRAQAMLGICYAELGRDQEAVPLLAPAFRKPPDPALERLIGLDLQRAYAGLHRFEQAAAVIDELLKRHPDDPEILFQASRFHAERSYELMTRLIQTAPDSAWVHYAMAEVHEGQQHYDLAVAEYRTVINMEPNLPRVHFRLGRALLLSSKEPKIIDEAQREFEKELFVAPENADAEYEIGEILRERNQPEKALEHFSRAVQLHPEFGEAQIGLARVLISLGRTQEALPHLQEAARLDPQNEVPHFLLASAYKALGDRASSEKEMGLFQELREKQPRQGTQSAAGPATPEVTRQTIGSDSPASP